MIFLYFFNIFMTMSSSSDIDYIIDILKYLEDKNIDTSNYDDDNTYYDGFDDVYVVNIKDYKLKFVQNKIFSLYYNNKIITGYENIKNELDVLLCKT